MTGAAITAELSTGPAAEVRRPAAVAADNPAAAVRSWVAAGRNKAAAPAGNNNPAAAARSRVAPADNIAVAHRPVPGRDAAAPADNHSQAARLAAAAPRPAGPGRAAAP